MTTLRVKNMVCDRCILTVKALLTDMQLHPVEVALGQAMITEPLSDTQKEELSRRLQQAGFELLEDASRVIVEQIKNRIIRQIHHRFDTKQSVNWSVLLSQELHRDYSSLSKLFSEREGITIEQYIIRQKIERVKELLLNDELSLSQIAYDMGYSSTAHLSAQFKKTTGFTPSQYKQSSMPQRNTLDSI